MDAHVTKTHTHRRTHIHTHTYTHQPTHTDTERDKDFFSAAAQITELLSIFNKELLIIPFLLALFQTMGKT